MLSWWQRKAASAFVAEPPSSSIEEALENFLKVESKKKNTNTFKNAYPAETPCKLASV